MVYEDGLEVEVGSRGRITVVCMADSLDTKELQSQALLATPHSQFTHYPEVLHQTYCDSFGVTRGDIFYYDYGVVVMWGFSQKDLEDDILRIVDKVVEDPLDASEVQVDEFEYLYR